MKAVNTQKVLQDAIDKVMGVELGYSNRYKGGQYNAFCMEEREDMRELKREWNDLLRDVN